MIKNKFMAANINPQKVADLIRDLADRIIVPRWKALSSHEINTKSGPNDLVTVADREMEIALGRELTKMYPGAILIGEEGISAGSASTSSLGADDQVVFVADPVDGTWNFVHGDTEFAVMLACVHNGETRIGWIYDVPARRMMIAEKGKGAFIDGIRQTVAAPKILKECNGFTGSIYFPKVMRPHINNFEDHVKSLGTLRCAGHEYLRIISGQADFAVYSKIRPWDHLAGTLAVQEAGGRVIKFDNTPYEPSDEFGGLVVASNDNLLKELQAGLVTKLVDEYKKRGPH